MFSIFRTVALGVGLTLSAVTAQAAVFHYDLHDHPDGALNTHDYGLRLDKDGKVFSFDNGAQAFMTYDDVAGTVSLFGTMRESLGNGVFGGGLWNLSYSMTGVTDQTGGFFIDSAGNGGGTIAQGGTSLTLGAKSKSTGEYFLFINDGHRLGNHPAYPYQLAGRGWVNTPNAPNCCNDFLFTASLRDTPPPGPNPVPLPAAGWMLIAGLGGLRVLKSRRRNG